MNNNQTMSKIAQYNTMHTLHLLLSIITAGLWVPVWVLITMSNAMERSRLMRKLK